MRGWPDRRTVLWVFTGLDGYTAGPGGEFIGPEWSTDLDGWTRELRGRADTLVFGRRTWVDLAGYWPAAERDPKDDAELEVARYMNETRKVVFSRTVDTAEGWANSELAAGEPAEILPGLRQESSGDIAVLGSADLAATLMRDDLIDEYCLLILPKLFGGGTHLFPDGRPRASLRLLHHRALDTGAVFLRYGRTDGTDFEAGKAS